MNASTPLARLVETMLADGIEPSLIVRAVEAAERSRRVTPSGSTGRGTRLVSNWTPSAAQLDYARAMHLPDERIALEAEKFRNYWTARTGAGATKRDWDATWRNWILTAMERRHDVHNTEPLERIALPDVRRPERTPCLPEWAASRIAALRAEYQPHPRSGRWREALTLPEHLMPTAAQRDEMAIHIAELRELCRQTPLEDPDIEQSVLKALMAMFVTLASAAQNEIGAELRGEAFLASLEDLPGWATVAATRRWFRGDCGDLAAPGQQFNFHFCPSPAELRRIAFAEMMRVKGRAEELQRVLDAEALREFSDAHRAAMLAKLAQLKFFGTPPVGSNGSGGAAGDKPAEGAHCGTQPKAQPGPKREGGCRRRGDRRK